MFLSEIYLLFFNLAISVTLLKCNIEEPSSGFHYYYIVMCDITYENTEVSYLYTVNLIVPQMSRVETEYVLMCRI